MLSEESFVDLRQEVGLQASSELSTTNTGWTQMCRKQVPDDAACDA